MGDPNQDLLLERIQAALQEKPDPEAVPSEDQKLVSRINAAVAVDGGGNPVLDDRRENRQVATEVDAAQIGAGGAVPRRPVPIPRISSKHGTISFGPQGARLNPDAPPAVTEAPAIEAMPADAVVAEFARNLSEGILQLPTNIVSKAAIDNRALDLHNRFQSTTPRIAASVAGVEEQSGKAVAPALNRLLAQIELTPLTPQEIQPVARLALDDYSRALGEGRLATGLGKQEVRMEAIQENPDLAQEVIMKLLSVDDDEDVDDLLRTDGPFGDEKMMARDLRGFTRYLRQKEAYYKSRFRLSKVLGHDLPQNFGGNLFDSVPNESPFDLNVFGERIPWLQQLQQTASDRAATREQMAAIEADAISQLGPMTQIGIGVHEKGGLPGLGVEAGMTALHWIDQGTFGLLGQLIQDADKVLGAGGWYQGVKGNMVKGLLTGTGTGQDLEKRYNYMLAAYPDLDPDRVRDETGRLFTTSVLLGELPSMTKALTGVDIAELSGTDESGIKKVFNQLGSFFDSPTVALLSLGVVPKIAKEVKLARAKQMAAAEGAIFDELRGANFQDIVATSRGRLLRGVLERMSKNPKNANMARRTLNRFVEEINSRGWKIGPELFGKLQTAWTHLERGANARAGGGVLPSFRSAVRLAADTVTPDSIHLTWGTQSAKLPGLRQVLDPKAPLNLSNAGLEYMTRVGQAALVAGALENLPQQLQGPRGTMLRKAAEAFFADNIRRNRAKDAHTTARRALRAVNEDLAQTSSSLVNELETLSAERLGQVELYNDQLLQAVTRARQFELNGGRLPTARRTVRGKTFGDAVLASENPVFAKRWMFSNQGRFNRRLANQIGGPELVREIAHLLREQEIARSMPGRQAGRVLDRYVTETIQSYARSYVNEAVQPEWRWIQANPKPRTKTFDTILRKAEKLEQGEPLKLSKAELDLLNEFQPRGAPLTENFLQDLSLFDRGLKMGQTRVKQLLERRKAVEGYLDKIENIPPGDIPGFRINRQIHRLVSDYMDEPLSQVLYGDYRRGGGFSLSEPQVLKSWRELWSDLVKELPEERRLLEREIIKRTAYEVSSLPPHLQNAYGFEESLNAQRELNWVQIKAAEIAAEMDTKLTPKQRGLLADYVRTGELPAGLPAETADHIAGLMWKQRVEQLQADLLIGKLSVEKYAEFARRDYLPELYEKNPQLADDVARVTEPVFRNVDLDRLLEPADHNYKTRTRTDDWSVAYKQKGRTHLQKGFKTEADARQWANRQLPQDVKYEVREPYPYDLKVADGLIRDPALAHGTLMERLARDRSLYAAQYLFSQTSNVRPHAEIADFLRQRGIDVRKELRRGRILIDFNDGAGPRKLYRIRNKQLPHWDGKWVDADAMAGLTSQFQGYHVFEALAQGIKESGLRAQSKQFASLVKFFTKEAVGITNNLLATTHVPLNVLSYQRGFISNLSYAQLAGFDLTNPVNLARFAYYSADLVKDLAPAAKRAVPLVDAERLFLKTKTGSYIADLIKDDQIHVGEPVFNAEMARAASRFHDGTKGLRLRFEDIQGRLSRYFDEFGELKNPADFETVVALAKKAMKINADLQKASVGGFGGFVGQFLGSAARGALDAIRGKGEIPRKAWAAYIFGSFDTPMKIITYRYLRDVEGLSKTEALGRCRDFFQQIHNPGKIAPWIPHKIPGIGGGIPAAQLNKWLGQSFAGAMFMGFKTEQLRIYENALKHGKRRLGRYLGAVAAWNYATLLGSGESLDEYGAAFAHRHKMQPGTFAKALSLLQGIRLGRNRQIGSDTLYGTFFLEPITPFGKGIQEWIGGDVASPLPQRILGGMAGALGESFAIGSAAAAAVQTVIRGATSFGTPLRWGTLGRIGREMFFPPLLGGYEWSRLTRVAGGNDINPQTYEGRGFGDFVKERLLSIRRMYGSDQRLQAAYHYVRAFNSPGRGGNFISDEMYEEMMHSLVAFGAVDPKTGEVDPEKQDVILRDYFRGKQKFEVLPGGGTRPLPLDEESLERAKAATRLPKMLYNISRENLVNMMRVYALWRTADRSPDPKWDTGMIQLISTKLSNRAADPATLLEAINYVKEATTEPSLPSSAKQQLELWLAGMLARY